MKLEEARVFWGKASDFPPDKESVYPDHAAAHEFDEQAKGKVLEYGCGGGSDTVSLLRRGAQVTFVDISPRNMETTRERLRRDFNDYNAAGVLVKRHFGFTLEQSEDLPFDDCLFDSINCHGVLHHIPEETMHKVIDSMFRVLRPGGCLYAMLYTEHLRQVCDRSIQTMMRDSGYTEEQALSMNTDGGGIARWYTEETGRALFEQHGFEFVKANTYNNGDFRTFIVRRPSVVCGTFDEELLSTLEQNVNDDE